MAHNDKHSIIRQSSKIADVTYIIPMTRQEARAAVDGIRTRLADVAAQLRELHERQGWKALGYVSWNDCVEAEFAFSRQRAQQLMDYDQVRENVRQLGSETSTMVDVLPEINERQARPLAKLEPEEQRAVWRDAVESAPNHQPTAKDVGEMVIRRASSPTPLSPRPPSPNAHTRPAPKPVSSGKVHIQPKVGRDVRDHIDALLDSASSNLVQEIYTILCERLECGS